MSEENIEIVRRLFEVFQEAFKRGDPAAVFDSPLVAADAERPSKPLGCRSRAMLRRTLRSGIGG